MKHSTIIVRADALKPLRNIGWTQSPFGLTDHLLVPTSDVQCVNPIESNTNETAHHRPLENSN